MPIKSFKQFLKEDTGDVSPAQKYHAAFHKKLKDDFKDEYEIILNAAKRNNINEDDYDNLSLLYAIRKSENGGYGKEFGVLAPGARPQKGETPQQSLDKQAGWAASTILKNRERYNKEKPENTDFVTFMGGRWAPIGVANDPTNLNKNWVTNVNKFKTSYMECMGPNCPIPTATQPTPKSEPPVAPAKPPEPIQPTQPWQDSGSPKIPPLLNEPSQKTKKV